MNASVLVESNQLDLFSAIPPKVFPELKPVAMSQAVSVDSPLIPLAIVQPVPLDHIVGSVSSSVVKDAGAELVYNRRNRIKSAVRWNDISHLNDSLKVKECVKSNVWPKPDYKQLITDGMEPMVAHIVKQVYDSIAIKPISRGVLDDAALQLYIAGVSRIEAGVMAWSRDRDALKAWANSNAKIAGAMLGKYVNLSEINSQSNTLLKITFPEGFKNSRDELNIMGGKVLGTLQPGYEEIERAVKSIKKGWPESRESWEIQGYRVIENPAVEVLASSKAESLAVYFDNAYIGNFQTQEEVDKLVASLKPFGTFSKRKYLDSFLTENEALESVRDLSRRERKETIGDKGVKVEAVERVGPLRRLAGEDISSERLMTEFDLKGVNFGNWMKTPAARAEAQLHLNYAFDSLHDLAEILGLSPAAMSLNGMLGLAIGAQGGGGTAAAHFVPGVNEINITREYGSSFFAHEFGHAVDHCLAVKAGISATSEPYLSAHANENEVRTVRRVVDGASVNLTEPRFGELDMAVVKSFGSVVTTMNTRLQTVDEANVAASKKVEKSKTNVNNWLKGFRRDFTGLEEAFDVLADKVRAGEVGEGRVKLSSNVYVCPVVNEIRDLFKSKHGRVYSIENIKGLQAWIDRVEYESAALVSDKSPVLSQVPTVYAESATELDNLKGGKPYWSTTVEKFARVFDAYVSDELQARGMRNDYLSHSDRHPLTVPSGDERLLIGAAIKSLVGKLGVLEVGVVTGLPVVSEGVHHGLVLDVSAGIVTQKVGRDVSEVVHHSVRSLTSTVSKDDVVSIGYKGGRGEVSLIARDSVER